MMIWNVKSYMNVNFDIIRKTKSIVLTINQPLFIQLQVLQKSILKTIFNVDNSCHPLKSSEQIVNTRTM
jgi:hypothetical protein